MDVKVRPAVDTDETNFVNYAVELSKFNRINHCDLCKYDDYHLVTSAIQRKAKETFKNRNEDTLILIAEIEGKPVGYALGRIVQQDETADNGTGRMGLFDELFVDDSARGLRLGHKLFEETIQWMKNRGINRVKLYAYSWNNHARRFYEHHGFQEYAVSYETFI